MSLNPSGADPAGSTSTLTPAAAGETETRMITFKSVGHFFASAFKKLAAAEPKIAADLKLVQGAKPVVEGVTQAAAPELVPLEDAGFAVLGEVASLLNAGGEAMAAKLANVGFDVNVINMAKQVLAAVPQIAQVAKAL